MPNTRHSKCLEYHIKIANYLIQMVQQDKLNRPQVGRKKKYHKRHIFSWGLHTFFILFYFLQKATNSIDQFFLRESLDYFRYFKEEPSQYFEMPNCKTLKIQMFFKFGVALKHQHLSLEMGLLLMLLFFNIVFNLIIKRVNEISFLTYYTLIITCQLNNFIVS